MSSVESCVYKKNCNLTRVRKGVGLRAPSCYHGFFGHTTISPVFSCFSWMLRLRHSTYHSHFLRFIASTSGLQALHLSGSITLQPALALVLSFLSVSHSLAVLPFLHLSAPLPLCLPVLPSPPTPSPSYLLIICFILSAS